MARGKVADDAEIGPISTTVVADDSEEDDFDDYCIWSFPILISTCSIYSHM